MEEITYILGTYRKETKTPSEAALDSLGYIRRDITDIKTYYIRLGFHLDEFRKRMYFIQFNYSNFEEFCEKNLGLNKSAVSRCINVWKEFSLVNKGSYNHTMFIDKKYEDYNYSQLCEMLSLTPDQRRAIKPSMTVDEIRTYKKSLKQKDTIEENKSCDVATFDYDEFSKYHGIVKKNYIKNAIPQKPEICLIDMYDSEGNRINNLNLIGYAQVLYDDGYKKVLRFTSSINKEAGNDNLEQQPQKVDCGTDPEPEGRPL